MPHCFVHPSKHLVFEDCVVHPYSDTEPKRVREYNYQILIVFFIVSGLLGVFFTLGYIMGRTSPLLLGPSTASAHESEPKPARPTVSEASIAAPTVEPAPPQAAKVIPAPPPPVVAPKPAEPRPIPIAAKVEKPATPPQAVAPSAGGPSGTYLQLVATNKEGADAIVGSLRDKGFPALAAEIPDKRGWFRALVGPLADSAIGSTRAQLRSAGFAGDQAIKRTF
jgi:hypothetical protein